MSLYSPLGDEVHRLMAQHDSDLINGPIYFNSVSSLLTRQTGSHNAERLISIHIVRIIQILVVPYLDKKYKRILTLQLTVSLSILWLSLGM